MLDETIIASMIPEPTSANAWLAPHAELLLRCYRHWTGRDLIDRGLSPADAARALYEADFVVLSHDTATDPCFNYANLTAQRLFERSWSDFIGLPSRLSAEPLAREERARLLEQVVCQGYTDGYSGVRVSASGRRFLVRQATVWNLIDPEGLPCGQAASFAEWQWI
jgi:hypothetical protein